MTNFRAPSGATGSACLSNAITLDRSALENALVDLDQAVASDDHLAYEVAYQAILSMIASSSAAMADVFEDFFGPTDASPEALAEQRFAERDARRR